IDGSKISYLVLEPPAADHHRSDRQVDKKELAQLARSTATGAVLGVIVGAALGMAATLIPGIDTLSAAELLGTIITGAAVGGIWGAFSHMAAAPAWDKTFVAVNGGIVFVGV